MRHRDHRKKLVKPNTRQSISCNRAFASPAPFLSSSVEGGAPLGRSRYHIPQAAKALARIRCAQRATSCTELHRPRKSIANVGRQLTIACPLSKGRLEPLYGKGFQACRISETINAPLVGKRGQTNA